MQHADYVAQAGQLQLGDQHDHVADAHRRQIGRCEALAEVQDQPRVACPQQVDQPRQMVFVDQADVFHLHRVRQQRQPRRVLAQGTAQEGHVQSFDVHRRVGQRVIGDQVEGHIGVAQGEVEIHQRDVVCVVLSHVAAEVDRERRAADSAARTHDGNDQRLGARTAVGGGAAVGAGAAALAKPLQGEQQLFENDGGRQEFLGAGAEGLQYGLAVAARADGEDGHGGELAGQLLDQLQGLVVVGVERDHHDIGARLPGHVDKELVARAFGFEPNRLDAEQEIAERFARGVGGIDDRDSLHILHVAAPMV